MHELTCPSCSASAQYDLNSYLLMCPTCSATFSFDLESGRKEIFAEHFIIPNAIDSGQVRNLVLQWIKRIHHKPGTVEREYFITDAKGYSIPFWIVSLEAHTSWKGLVKRQKSAAEMLTTGYVTESGVFRRSYRWAVSSRKNICEHWGLTELHEPKEAINIEWDGFPLDSTFSRGRIDPTTGVKTSKESLEGELPAYGVREYFDFKFSNGLPILSVEIDEEEALRRARLHVELYHFKIAKLNVDIPVDIRTELDIAGLQLIHLPFWHIRYLYRPSSALRHFQKTDKKNIIIEGYTGGVLKSELAIIQRDKIWINAALCSAAALILFFLGSIWHPAFLLVAFFFLLIAGASAYIATIRRGSKENETSSFFYERK